MITLNDAINLKIKMIARSRSQLLVRYRNGKFTVSNPDYQIPPDEIVGVYRPKRLSIKDLYEDMVYAETHPSE